LKNYKTKFRVLIKLKSAEKVQRQKIEERQSLGAPQMRKNATDKKSARGAQSDPKKYYGT
jgi:hypothetical protein